MYKHLIRPILFLFDAESIHHATFSLLAFALKLPLMKPLLRALFVRKNPGLERERWGLHFPNPVGLAAGFDKDALIGTDWKYLGFGFVEIGTLTPRPQAGNPKKRLFRLPQDQAILNRMGFNNEGVDKAVERLKKMDKSDIIIGANIGKNKDTPNEQAVTDYQICFEKLYPYADYFVVNVSSPNTPGLRELQEKAPLLNLLNSLQQQNQATAKPKPILLKIAPDLTESQLDDIVEVVCESKIQGVIATNTTLSRHKLTSDPQMVADLGAGGISGSPLTERADEVLRYLLEKAEGRFEVIGVGGIMQPQDAARKLQLGAALVQVYSGFIYNGPGFVKRILKAMV